MSVLIITVLTIGAILRSHFINRRLRENARVWAELQGKLIERFSDAGEVVHYLESDAGKRLLEGQSSSPASPHARILDSVHLGLLVMMGGLGITAAAGVSDPKIAEFMRVLGQISSIVGVGFLASAGISWALMRHWGMLGKRLSSSADDRTELGV